MIRSTAGFAGHLARGLALAGLAATFALSSASPVFARDGAVKVDVELVLAVDISFSMDPVEQRMQRAGYVQAITSPEFIKAVKSGTRRKIVVTYIQWASAPDQNIVVPWTVIDGPETAKAFAEQLSEAPYRRARRTSISAAIDYSAKLFEKNGYVGLRQVIDVSGDGTNNDGRPVNIARDAALAKGITINGLPLLIRPSNWGFSDITNLDEYYEDCVIGGLGSFVIPIKDVKQFIRATRTKLVMEIATPMPAIQMQDFAGEGVVIRAQARRKKPRVSCLIGEMMWRERWGR